MVIILGVQMFRIFKVYYGGFGPKFEFNVPSSCTIGLFLTAQNDLPEHRLCHLVPHWCSIGSDMV